MALEKVSRNGPVHVQVQDDKPMHGEQEQPMNDERVAWRGVVRHRRFEAMATRCSRVK
jgi:hypothetical protein